MNEWVNTFSTEKNDPKPSSFIETKIQFNSLVTQVYDLLWKRIINQQIQPGQKLSDLQLSKDFGISRTPIREALYRLVQEGIVLNQNQRGFYLITFSGQDVKEIYDLRMALEVLAVRLALPNLTQEDLDNFQVDLDEVKQLISANTERAQERFLTIDRKFHKLLVQSSHNGRLEASLESLLAQIKVFQLYGIHLKNLVDMSFEHHQAIVSALLSRNEKEAVQAMERHIREVKAHVLDDFVSVTRA